ncbi:MAG: hypothetical protein QOI29_5755, partial [Mycobacterium sp.]|nr:hypothetical protein [Mycobacterium sp.]
MDRIAVAARHAKRLGVEMSPQQADSLIETHPRTHEQHRGGEAGRHVLKIQARRRQSQHPCRPHQRPHLRGELGGAVLIVGRSCRHRRARAVAQLGVPKLIRAAGNELCCGEHRGGTLAPRRYRAAIDFPAVITVARDEPLHGTGSRLNIGDIEDGQCGGDSCRGGHSVCRSRPPRLGFVTDGGCAAALLRCSVGGVEVGGQDSTPIVSSGRG